MIKSLFNLLATLAFASGMLLSSPPQEIDTVIYKNGHISNVTFTLDQPIAIAQSDVPAAVMFTHDKRGQLVGVLYTIEKDFTLTEKMKFDPTAPQYVFANCNFAITVYPQP